MKKNQIYYFLGLIFVISIIFYSYSSSAKIAYFDEDVKVSIGAGMLRGTIAGVSHARRVGFGTNTRIVNNKNHSISGSWELIYSDFSGNLIKNRTMNFAIPADESIPYHSAIIIHTTLKYKISKLSMSVTIDDYSISREGIRIGPLNVLGEYNS